MKHIFYKLSYIYAKRPHFLWNFTSCLFQNPAPSAWEPSSPSSSNGWLLTITQVSMKISPPQAGLQRLSSKSKLPNTNTITILYTTSVIQPVSILTHLSTYHYLVFSCIVICFCQWGLILADSDLMSLGWSWDTGMFFKVPLSDFQCAARSKNHWFMCLLGLSQEL